MWRGPVFLALGFQRHLALRGSAWWSPKSWLVQHPVLLLDVSSALPGFDTCRDSLQYSSCGIGSGVNPRWGVCYCLVSAFPSLSQFHWPVVSIDEELCGRQVLSPLSHTGTSVSDLRPCDPLAQSCGLRLFLSSCRNPSGRWKPLHVAFPIFPGCAHHWIAWHSVHVACHSLIHHCFSLRYGVCGCMPVSLHYALSPMQFPVVVPVHWTPSSHPPYGSVLACAVPAVFYTPDSGS